MSLSELTSLQNTLNSALAVYKAELAAEGLPDVSLETSKPHPTDDLAYLPSPAMYEARRLVIGSLVSKLAGYSTCNYSTFSRAASKLSSSHHTMPSWKIPCYLKRVHRCMLRPN